MSQRVTKKRTASKPAPRRGAKLAQSREEERLLEARARLQLKADEARREFIREMVKTAAVAFVIVTVCAVSVFLICRPEDTGARPAGTALLSSLVGIVVGAAYGKRAGGQKG